MAEWLNTRCRYNDSRGSTTRASITEVHFFAPDKGIWGDSPSPYRGVTFTLFRSSFPT